MKQFTLQLDKGYQRPMIALESWYNFVALLDTGAFFPVWTANERLLAKVGGTLEQENVTFRGFGGETIGNLYRLESLVIGDLIFPNMSIIACEDMKQVPFQLILSATMFNNLIYEIDNRNHKLNVTIPDSESLVRNLKIKNSEGKLFVFCNSES